MSVAAHDDVLDFAERLAVAAGEAIEIAVTVKVRCGDAVVNSGFAGAPLIGGIREVEAAIIPEGDNGRVQGVIKSHVRPNVSGKDALPFHHN